VAITRDSVAKLPESLQLGKIRLVIVDKEGIQEKDSEIRAWGTKAQRMVRIIEAARTKRTNEAKATKVQRTMVEKEEKVARMEKAINQERGEMEKREERDLVTIGQQEPYPIFSHISQQALVNVSQPCASFEDARY
jgi:IS5 family transposase